MPRRDPERTCIVTRAVLPPARLIRFVADPGGTLVADLKNRLPGRGAWVSARADIVARAVERKAFSRALKREVTVPADLAATIDEALQREARQALSLANKAGAAVTGFAKVEAAIAAGPIAALIHAREASEDGRRKLAGALRRRLGDTISAVPVVTEFAGQELDLAFGRSNVIHAALVAERAATASSIVGAGCASIAGFRTTRASLRRGSRTSGLPMRRADRPREPRQVLRDDPWGGRMNWRQV